MNIKIHRITPHQNLMIEISTAQTKILLDGGMNLEEQEAFSLHELQSVSSFADMSAIFLFHYHNSYPTLTKGLLDGVPLYTSKLSGAMTAAAEEYKAKQPPTFAGFYQDGIAIAIGDMTITPYLVDDVAYAGYLLIVRGEGKCIAVTADYHANGRKSFADMRKELPEQVDLLLCEGGVLTKEDINPITERDLEEQTAKLIAEKKGPVFVLQSPTDFDRATTLFRCAKRNKRLFLQDLSMSHISSSAGKVMPNPKSWTGVRAYLTTGYKPEHPRYKLFTQLPRVNKTDIETQKFVMCIRPSMKKYLKTLAQGMRFKDGLILNMLPASTRNAPEVQAFMAFAAEKGLEAATLSSSGHADAMALKVLIAALKPTKLLPLLPQEARWLAGEHPSLCIVEQDEISL